MADFTNSPNMNLPVPTVGVVGGPLWATLLDSCLSLIDSHNHTSGNGAPIPSAALNINADLSMIGNNLTNIRTLRLAAQTSVSGPLDVGVLYEIGSDLYYRDGTGVQIRITQSGSVTGSSGTITGLPSGTASVVYDNIGKTYVFQSATNIAANLDSGSLILRNLSPNSTYAVTLSPPAGLSANSALTLPPLPASTRMLSLSSAGVINTAVAGVILTADIGAAQVTGAKIASATIGPSNIIVSSLTGVLFAANPDFPLTPKSNGKNVIVSNTNAGTGLEIVRGIVAPGGTVYNGEGWTVSSHPSPGVYVITLTTAMFDTPAVTSNTISSGSSYIAISSATTSSFVLTNASGADDSFVSFIAIGLRA